MSVAALVVIKNKIRRKSDDEGGPRSVKFIWIERLYQEDLITRN